MTFSEHLPTERVNRLVESAVESDLVPVERELLLQGILGKFRLALKKVADPLTQFQLDLIRMNEVERLANGQVPIVQYLRNAATQLKLRGLPQAAEFDNAANQIGNRTQGVPLLPETRTLPEIIRDEAIVGVDDMLFFEFLSKGQKVGKSVARLRVPRYEDGAQIQTAMGEPWLMNGTAWIIGPKLILTNHHVIRGRLTGESEPSPTDIDKQASNSTADFDFDEPASNLTTIRVDKVLVQDKALDFALLRLASDPGRTPLTINPQKIVHASTSYIPVNIIQHPNGNPKRIAMRNNLITGSDENTIRYFTDTDNGSSGAPVCDDEWRVVALHRGAKFVSDVNYQGKPTAFVNFGSQIQPILQRIRAIDIQLFQEITGR